MNGIPNGRRKFVGPSAEKTEGAPEIDNETERSSTLNDWRGKATVELSICSARDCELFQGHSGFD